MGTPTPEIPNLECITLAEIHEGIESFIKLKSIKINNGVVERSLRWNYTDYLFILGTSENDCIVIVCYDDKIHYIAKSSDGTFKTGNYII